MTEPTDLEVTRAYTRQAVEEYLRDVEVQRRELEAAIAHTRARTARALEVERRIVALEHRVGEWIVAAHAQADTRHMPPSATGWTGATDSPPEGVSGEPVRPELGRQDLMGQPPWTRHESRSELSHDSETWDADHA